MLVEASEETEHAVVVANVARGRMDCTGSTVPESLDVVAEDTCDINECMAFAGHVAFVFAGDAAVALPAVPGAASPAVLAKVVADDAVSLADAGTVTVAVASLADAGKVTVGVADLAVAGAVSLADPGMVFPADLAEKVTVNVAGLVVAGGVPGRCWKNVSGRFC